ncbi:helix-turn-helix transcriptional regulator [Acidiphilium sp. AL]|uniref:Helix-turn-helix transcriptional regulator n=1 Tax=Acidiphilium iwatense TaxID=768198 RepID=A0ABS9E3W8_9PROT|nr:MULTISPECIES: helix-turn-helix transcriptional regulator [Acidiphilium]MCF3948284.1 helix-turn-helix transcriptional regulator [Acidiphilium iwatense]MCU4161249.1 helix-turn-helix transcriptional regulator [Acidiphilium sp. AL]
MRHDDIWRAIDTLAAERGLSTSGLARSAGLDPTSFNPSKRRAEDGRLRWPSTESIAKILAATGASFDAFAALVRGSRSLAHSRMERVKRSTIPLIGLAQAGQDGFFDDAGYPAGAGWEQIDLPSANAGLADDPLAYGLTIQGDSMEPVYRAGDVIIVSPSAPVRAGDRVVARTRSGEVMAKLLARRTARRIELASFNPDHAMRAFSPGEIAAIHRIVWASQ